MARMCCLACQGSPDHAVASCATCGGFGYLEVKRCGYGDGTNQLAELIALVYAMRMARPDEPTLIVSDSEYSINAVSGYRRRWEASNYRTVEGRTISYVDLIKYAHQLHDEKPSIRFKHVRGHTGVEGNEAADQLACLARYVGEGKEPLDKVTGMVVEGF